MNSIAKKIIEKLQLKPLEMEGGYFRRTYTSGQETNFDLDSSKKIRPNASAIYFFLTPETHSKIHRLPIDEVYHFYLGDPVELLLLDKNGKAEVIELGTDILNDAQTQFVVPKNAWQGSRLKLGGEFALLGTTMAPAFEYIDFETPEDLQNLQSQYPSSFADLIKSLS